MADKIDQIKIGTTAYDIDLPPDATPSIASITASGTIKGGAIKKNGGTASQFLKADGSVDTHNYITAYDNQTITCEGTTFGANAAVSLVAGENVALTPDTSASKITISAVNTWPSVTADNPTLSWGANSKVGTVGNTSFYVTMPTNPNTWPPVTAENPTLSWGTNTKVGTVGNTSFYVTMPANPMPSVTANNPTLAWNTNKKIGTVGNTSFYVTMPANPIPSTYIKEVYTGDIYNGWGTEVKFYDQSGTNLATLNALSITTPSNGLADQRTNSSSNDYWYIGPLLFRMGYVANSSSTTSVSWGTPKFNARPWVITQIAAAGDTQTQRATATSISSGGIAFGYKSNQTIVYLAIGPH